MTGAATGAEKDPAGKGAAGPSTFLTRGLRALEAVAAKPMTASAIARVIGVNRSSALRMMQELESAGYVRRDTQMKQYSINAARFVLMVGSGTDHADWSELVDPVLAALRDDFHEATIAGVPANGVMVYTSFFPSTQAVAVREQLGTTRPMYASALGRAYLSAIDATSIDVELGRLDYVGGTDRAPKGPLELRERLDAIRRDGYAVDDEETFLGVACVAAPARIGSALVGAIGVSGPAGRIRAIGYPVIGRRLIEELERFSRPTHSVVRATEPAARPVRAISGTD